ncbi:MAG: MarR family transcriptional regulator [Clostridiaceae bacterium]|nr:MarR family transcriptional regulator [Clostridiaceae bacterium]
MDEKNKGIIVVKLLKNVMGAIKQNVEYQFKDMSLTGPQAMLIGTLAHNGQMKISDLGEKLGLSSSTVSGIVDRLEKQGLVERVRSKDDRRVVYVNLTVEFRKSAKNGFERFEEKLGAIMNEATDEDVDKIFEGLEILKSLIDRQNKQIQK